jgi:ADP-ribose pyrophosphatase
MKEIWELPAGTLSVGEDPLACAKRELIEETNYSAAQWESLGQLYPAPGFCDEVQYIYLARKLTPAVGALDHDEIITVHAVKFGDFERMIGSNEILDAKSVAIYFKAKLAGLLP